MADHGVGDVVPRPEGWAVQREGTSQADSLHDTKEAATDRGVGLAESARGQLRTAACPRWDRCAASVSPATRGGPARC
jgi:Uncharacterized protein conserved in bacteria (DUF2188)